MTGLVHERLAGCTSQSLDSYLRGVGFFLLAGDADPAVRSWWDEDGVLWLASSQRLEVLCEAVADRLLQAEPPLRTPFRGAQGRGTPFVAHRNAANEAELDWLDACALARSSEPVASEGAPRSDRENNPLLGQGGAFGRSDTQAAYEDALTRLRKGRQKGLKLARTLAAVLTGEPLDARVARSLSTSKVALGAYQSGRATGPGASARDVDPSNQPIRSIAWDVILVLTGLRLFRGAPARRPEPSARVQASFPFIVQSRPIGTGPEGVIELRSDDPGAYELLAPLWSQPCAPRVLRHLFPAARLRVRRGVARDTLDAVLVQAGRAARGLGFDRLVRFALVAGSDPRYRYAVRRGEIRARGVVAAHRALDEIVPFLRDLDRAVRESPPGIVTARRRLEDALAGFGQEQPGQTALPPARRAQQALVSLALLQTPAARAVRDEMRAPSLSSAWLRLADDASAEYRLARALVARLSTHDASILRRTLLPQHQNDQGRWALDPARTPPDLEHVAEPVATLVRESLAALRLSPEETLAPSGSARFDDLSLLLSGSLGGDGERRLALLCAALAGVRPAQAPEPPKLDPCPSGIGADVARLLLAAQPSEDEEDGARRSLERAAAIASLLLAGQLDLARVVADRELRRRGLDLLPVALARSWPARPPRLALAVLLPFDQQARAQLARIVSVTDAHSQEGGLS